MKNKFIIILVGLTLLSCRESAKLPVLGPTSVNEAGDSVKFSVPSYSYVSQNNEVITNESLKGKVYVAEFFFTSCPSICPIMTSQLLRVHEKFKENELVRIVSFTLDPKYDTPARMKEHAERLGIDTKQWLFLNGDKAKTYELAQKGFFVTALEDATQPGGIVHSGKVSLIDGDGHVRGYYDGTIEQDVNLLINDISILLSEND